MKSVLLIGAALGMPAIASAVPAGADPLTYSGPAWSPYLVGALIGVLSWLTFIFPTKPSTPLPGIRLDSHSLDAGRRANSPSRFCSWI